MQTRKVDDVECWVQSTTASELNTPTEPATPPVPQLSWPNRSPHGSSVASGSISSGTIPIGVQPLSRPTKYHLSNSRRRYAPQPQQSSSPTRVTS
ncbi:hypothetical protein E4T56_gene8850 [Termitomyces sp. T112]|nr:hypothetical protein E4T56_gene8850 [Termitomyces sp. T112]